MLYIKMMRSDGNADASSALVQRTCQDLFRRKILSEVLWVCFVPSWVSPFFSISLYRVFRHGGGVQQVAFRGRHGEQEIFGNWARGDEGTFKVFPHVVPDTKTQRGFCFPVSLYFPANSGEKIKRIKRSGRNYKHWTVCAFRCAGGRYWSRNSVCAACRFGVEKIIMQVYGP